MKQTDSTVFRVGFSHFVVLYRKMLFICPIILLCFNLVYIDCDMPNKNLEKNPRGNNFASRYVRPSEISTTIETIDIIGINDLPPQMLIDQGEPKKNITRVRKQKRRRVVNKTIVPNDNNLSLEKIKEPEIATIAVAKFGEEHIEKKDLEQSIERNEDKIEPKQNSRLQVTSSPAKVNSEIQEKEVKEKLERNKNNVGGPRTFPKRPAEFNPVFKKRRERDPVVRIIDEKNYVYGHNGNFHFSFEAADGTKVFSKGNLLSSPIRQQKAGEAVVGGFAYKDEQGNDYSLSYTADEHGYQPVGAHLPTPPPIPPEIARALEYLATKPNPEPTEKYYSYY